MEQMKIIRNIFLVLLIFSISCSINTGSSEKEQEREFFKFETNIDGKGDEITIEFISGPSFYYPLVAIWLEELDGSYIQTLYVSESVASSIFMYGTIMDNKWKPGVRRYPQTLPYWAHKRGVLAVDGLYMPDPDFPVPDAYSGASPTSSFSMTSRSDNNLERPYKVLLEINQNWDWNEYWTNDMFPDNEYYKLSCQPALVYEAIVKPSKSSSRIKMEAIGHSHHSGSTGEIFTDLSTLTTALEIADSIFVYTSGN